MKRVALVLVGTSTLLVSSACYAAETMTIRGEVIDTSCYTAEGARGAGHAACALACIKSGQPAGILDEKTGKVFVIVTADHATNPASKVIPFVAKTVEVTGTVSERSGLSTIDIATINEVNSASSNKTQTTLSGKEKRS